MRGLTQSIGIVVAGVLGVGSAVAIGSESDVPDARHATGTLPQSLTINGVSLKHGRASRTITINGVPFKRGSSGNTITINGTPFKRSASGNTITINGTAFKGSSRGQTLTINGTAFKGSSRGQTLTINGTTFKSSGGTLTINGMVFRPGAGPTVPPEIAAQLRGPAGPAGPSGPAGAPGPAPGPAPVETPGPISVAASRSGEPTAPTTLASVTFTGERAHRLLLTGGFNTACDPCGSSPAFPEVDLALVGAASAAVRRHHPPLTDTLPRTGFTFSEVIVTPATCGPCTFVLRLSFPAPAGGAWALQARDIRLGLVDLGPVT